MKRANKILIHLLFWTVSFFIFSLAFNLSGAVSRIDLIFSGLFHISLFFGAYVNLVLLSILFNKRRYLLFALAIVATIIVAVFLNQLTFNHIADILFPGYYFVSHFESWEVVIVIMVYMLITTLLKLSYAWFELQKARQRLAVIEKENIKSELSMLKAQINDIFHLRAVGDYVQVFFNEKSILVHSTLQHLLGQLPSKLFIRVHRSHAIAINKVEAIESNMVRLNGKSIPIGQQYRTEFLNMIS